MDRSGPIPRTSSVGVAQWIFPDFSSLRTVEDRIAFWFDCMARCVAQLPSLRDAILLQLETASVSAEVQLAFKRHLFCSEGSSGNGRDPAGPARDRAQPLLGTSSRLRNATTRLDQGADPGMLASSLAYVTCWLAGQEFRSSTRHCGARKSYRDPAFGARSERLSVENRWRLHQLMSQREVQANQFGYTFKAFHRLAKLPGTDVLRARVSTAATAAAPAPQQLGVVTSWLRVSAALRPYLVVPPPAASRVTAPIASVGGSTASLEASVPPPPPLLLGETPSTGGVAGTAVRNVLVNFHKMGTDKEKPTGMDLRMAQIVESLVALQVQVHFVCQCDVDPSQLSPFGHGVAIYVGDLQQQFDQAMKAAELSGGLDYAYVFFTTFTMEVHHRQLAGDPDWFKEPTVPLPEERIVAWLHARSAAGRSSSSSPPVCVSAVADDIHYLRAVQVLGHPETLREKAKQASIWIKKRELAFHATVHNVVTVSSEDAATLRSVLETAPPPPPGSWAATTRRGECGHCSCDPMWVPFTHEFVTEAAVEPYARRRDGMLYVGGMHGLAVVAIQWLVTQVQPLIASLSPLGESALQPGGLGHLHLVGPGWETHLSELGAIKTSVVQGRATILGTLSEPQLNRQLAELKVFVAPVFNGTGIATKNVMAMARGIPLVTTTVGLQGLGLPTDQDAIFTADAPDEFAGKVVAVQTAESVWDAKWRGALAHTKRYLSADHQRDVLCELIRCNRPSLSAIVSGDSGGSGGTRVQSSPLLCPSGSQQQQLTTVRTEVARALAPPRSSNTTGANTALVVLGLEGSGASAVARSLLALPRLCVHPEPLTGLERAPLSAQLDHLRLLLSEPAYCKENLRSGPLPDVHGFALEFGVAAGGAMTVPATEVLGTRSGLLAMARLVSESASRLLLVRRCNTVAWAAGLVLASQLSPSDSPGSSSSSGNAARLLSPVQLSSTITTCRRSDVALQRLSATVGSLCGSLCQALQPLRQPLQSLTVDLELMQGSGANSDVPRLATFLGLPASTTLRAPVVATEAAGSSLGIGKSSLVAIEAALAADPRARQQLARIVAAGSGPLSARACDASWRQDGEAASDPTPSGLACTSGEQECALRTAVTAFAQQHQLKELEAPVPPPIIVIGAHSDEGGAAALSRILAQACRAVLTPRLGLRCAFRSGYDGCDPAVVDVCFLHEARFSEGRYTPRGYRYVHVRRDPAEVLARWHMRLLPNATRTQNSSALLESVETQARLLLVGELRDMAAVVEAHQSDRRTLPLKAEELLSLTHGNSTMRRLFGFLLGSHSGGAALVEDLVRAVWPAQQAAARAEAAGASQRQHLLKQLQRRPLKCSHFSRMQATLGYAPMACQNHSAGGGRGGVAAAKAPRNSRQVRRRHRRRLLGLLETASPLGARVEVDAWVRWSWWFGGRGDGL